MDNSFSGFDGSSRRHRQIKTICCLKVAGCKVSWVLDQKKKQKKTTRASSGPSSFQAEAASSSVPCITAEVTLTQSGSSHLLRLSVSASVSVELSLHQHLEVSLGRREEGVALTKSRIMEPVWADGSRPSPPSPPTRRSETQDWTPRREEDFTNEALWLRILHLLLLTAPPSPPLSAFSQDASVN